MSWPRDICVSCFAWTFIDTGVDTLCALLKSGSNSVHGLCDECFYECLSIRRVRFGCSSLLELIGVDWIWGTEVEGARDTTHVVTTVKTPMQME